MKKYFKIIAFASVFLALSAGTLIGVNSQPTNKAEDYEDWGGLKAMPFANRYDSSDILAEPKGSNFFNYNYQHMGTGGQTIEQSSIWDNHRGTKANGEKITVAVIDSGLDIYHEDFLLPEAKGIEINKKNVEKYSIIDEYSTYIHDPSEGKDIRQVLTDTGILNVYDDKTYNSAKDEYYSHGTASAACIGAAINGMGGFGVAPEVNLLIIKMDFFFTSLDVAIRYAVDNDADVINMSLGAYAESFVDGFGDAQPGRKEVATALQPAIDYATAHNVTLVAAAGNEKTDHKSYPACNKGVIGVGALDDRSGTKPSWFTNFNEPGSAPNDNNNVDVMAPGVVYTPNVDKKNYSRDPLVGKVADNYYDITQGTSFACPLTAGAVALYKASNPTADNKQVLNALAISCDDIGEPGWDPQFGYGRVNLLSLVSERKEVSSVSLSPNPINLVMSDEDSNPTEQLVPSFLPADSDIAYQKGGYLSDNENVAVVDIDTGLITAVGEGTANISYITDISGVEGTATVTVTDKRSHVDPPSVSTDSIVIDPGKHTLNGGYGWKSWTSGDIKGESYIYGGTTDKLQFNNNKTSYYIYNKTAVKGKIKSIGVTTTNDKSWSVMTSNEFFKPVDGIPTNGTKYGPKLCSANSEQVFNIDAKDDNRYFAICYEDSGASYISKVVITYEKQVKPTEEFVTLNVDKLTLDIGEYYTLKPKSSGGTITYSSSDASVASVNSSGVITAIKEGTTTIAARLGMAIAKCEVTVQKHVDVPKLSNITLSGSIPESVPFKGKIDISGIKVMASYTIGEQKDVTSNATFTNLSTDKIGLNTVNVSYSEGGIIKNTSFDVYITNIGASRTSSEEPSFNHSLTVGKTNYFTGNNSFISGKNGATWKLVSNGTTKYYGWDNNGSSSQIGSKNGPNAESFVISSDSFMNQNIDKVSVIARAGGSANMTVNVNNKSFAGVNNTLTTSFEEYVFIGIGKGKININVSDIDNAVYIKTITISFKGGTVYSWSGDEQASSFKDYLNNFRSCAIDFKNRNDVANLVKEFNAMVNDAKTSSILLDKYEDNGYQTSAMDKIKMMVAQYNNTLQSGEEKLVLELVNAPDGKVLESYDGLEKSLMNDDNNMLIILIFAIIGTVSAVIGCVYIINKRRKSHI